MKALSDIKARHKKKDERKDVTVNKVLLGKVPTEILPTKKKSKKAEKLTETQRKELNRINEEIETAMDIAEQGAEDIVKAAQRDAKVILDEAAEKRASAEELAEENAAEATRLSKKREALKKDTTQLEVREEAVTEETKRQKSERQEIKAEKQQTREKLEQINELLVDLASIVFVAAQKAKNISDIEDTVIGKVQHSLNQAKSLYNEIEKKEEYLSKEREALGDREEQVEQEELAIKDARKALKMAQKELKIK